MRRSFDEEWRGGPQRKPYSTIWTAVKTEPDPAELLPPLLLRPGMAFHDGWSMISDVIKVSTSSFHRRRPEPERRGEERLTDVVVTEALLEQVSKGERAEERVVGFKG